GFPGAIDLSEREPAGDPPQWWPGTRPEWAVYWGLLQNGRDPQKGDFIYRAMMPSVGSSYYSTTDFLLNREKIAIEIQGEYWHYAQGPEKLYHDRQRMVLFESMGWTTIFID